MSLHVSGLKRSAWNRLQANWAKRLGRLWHPVLYGSMLLGFLSGRALPESQIGPIGVAFYVAARGAGLSPGIALAAGLATSAGFWTVLPGSQAFWASIALVLSHVLASALRIGTKNASPLGAAVVASTAVAVPAVMLAGTASLVTLVLWCGLTGMLAMVFTLGMMDILSGSLWRGGTTDSPVPAVVILAAALCGLAGVPIRGWASLQDIAAGFVVLLFASAGGPPLGAAVAAVLGVSFLLTGLGSPGSALGVGPEIRAMAYVVAGLVGGLFRDLSRLGVGVAFFLGLIMYLMIGVNGTEDLMALGASAGVAVLLYWVAPRWLLGRLDAPIPMTPTAAHTEEAATAEPAPVANRVRGMARVMRELGRAFRSPSADERTRTVGRAFEQVTDRVCHSCAMYRHCWETDSTRTYKRFDDLWARVSEEGPLATQPPPENLRDNCIYPAEIAATLNYLFDLNRSHNRWGERLEEARGIAGDYVKNAAKVLEQLAEEVQRPVVTDTMPPAFNVVSGVARLPKRGSQVSGDSYTCTALGQSRYLVALSDGMGVGVEASADSRQALNLFQDLMNAGFGAQLAVETVNSMLLLRTPEDSFVTIDLAVIDLVSGQAEFVKIGAAPSFIRRGRDVTVIKQASVPVGIFDQVEVESEFRMLRHGDLIVMVTDGVWDVCRDDADKELWLIQQLRKEPGNDPETLAESLLAQALELSPDAGDDMTVLVARVDSLRTSEAAPETPPAHAVGWAPAKVAPKGGPTQTRRRPRR